MELEEVQEGVQEFVPIQEESHSRPPLATCPGAEAEVEGVATALGVWREAPDTAASWDRGGELVGRGSNLFCVAGSELHSDEWSGDQAVLV